MTLNALNALVPLAGAGRALTPLVTVSEAGPGGWGGLEMEEEVGGSQPSGGSSRRGARGDPRSASILRQGRLLSTQQVWVFPDETGGTHTLHPFAAQLRFPAWGLNIVSGAAAASATPGAEQHPASLDTLAHAFAAAITSAQPVGPYLLLGVGPFSCTAAFTTACVLEKAHAPVMLVMVDGAPCAAPAQLHDPAHYALYAHVAHQQALAAAAAAATARGGPAAAAAAAAAASAAHQVAGLPLDTFVAMLVAHGSDIMSQVRALRSFRPGSAAAAGAGTAPPVIQATTPEAWDASMLAVMARAGTVRQLMAQATTAPVFRGPVALAVPEDRVGEGEAVLGFLGYGEVFDRLAGSGAGSGGQLTWKLAAIAWIFAFTVWNALP